MEAKNAEQWYDGMTIHPYSDHVDGGNDANAFYDNAMKRAEVSGIGKVKNKMALLEPKGKVPVISEFGIYNNYRGTAAVADACDLYCKSINGICSHGKSLYSKTLSLGLV